MDGAFDEPPQNEVAPRLRAATAWVSPGQCTTRVEGALPAHLTAISSWTERHKKATSPCGKARSTTRSSRASTRAPIEEDIRSIAASAPGASKRFSKDCPGVGGSRWLWGTIFPMQLIPLAIPVTIVPLGDRDPFGAGGAVDGVMRRVPRTCPHDAAPQSVHIEGRWGCERVGGSLWSGRRCSSQWSRPLVREGSRGRARTAPRSAGSISRSRAIPIPPRPRPEFQTKARTAHTPPRWRRSAPTQPTRCRSRRQRTRSRRSTR